MGDSLSPYIFLLCINILSYILLREEKQKVIEGFRLGQSGVCVSHLPFADDLLLHLKASPESCCTLSNIFHFRRFSGLKINPLKSEFFFVAKIL